MFNLGDLANVAGALVVGAVTKKLGVRSADSGRLPFHKVGSPLGAVVAAAAVEVIRAVVTGDAINPEPILAVGLQDGGTAIAIHTAYKNGRQFLDSLKAIRRRSDAAGK